MASEGLQCVKSLGPLGAGLVDEVPGRVKPIAHTVKATFTKRDAISFLGIDALLVVEIVRGDDAVVAEVDLVGVAGFAGDVEQSLNWSVSRFAIVKVGAVIGIRS